MERGKLEVKKGRRKGYGKGFVPIFIVPEQIRSVKNTRILEYPSISFARKKYNKNVNKSQW